MGVILGKKEKEEKTDRSGDSVYVTAGLGSWCLDLREEVT
jgi:hypothetical protein